MIINLFVFSHEINLQVLKEFVALHTFENKRLDAALRYDLTLDFNRSAIILAHVFFQ